MGIRKSNCVGAGRRISRRKSGAWLFRHRTTQIHVAWGMKWGCRASCGGVGHSSSFFIRSIVVIEKGRIRVSGRRETHHLMGVSPDMDVVVVVVVVVVTMKRTIHPPMER